MEDTADSAQAARARTGDGAEVGDFSRWPGILRLALGVLLPPAAVLTNQELIYMSGVWVCGLHYSAALHVVPVLCLILCAGAGVTSYRDWQRVGGGLEEEHGSAVVTRTRFLALCGMGVAAISALLTVAQWLAVFVFGPCMRA